MATTVEVTPRLLYADYNRTLIIQPAEHEDPEILFERTCADFENTKIEQDSQGNIRIMAPTGGESSDQISELNMQLRIWAKRDGRGRVFDSSVAFILPDQSKLGPDAAWASKKRLSALPRLERRKFLRVVPEFVVELKSPTDRYSDLKKKMGDYIRNGVELGWLIHPDQQQVLIYTQGNVQALDGINVISGTGPVEGFTLDLAPIWEGLDF